MEGQPIPRPQPLNLHGHHPKLRQTISSPSTSVTSPIVLKGVTTQQYPKLTSSEPVTKLYPKLPPNDLPANRGWTSFDESPVHSTPGKNFPNSAGKTNWTPESKWDKPSPIKDEPTTQKGPEDGGQDPWVITVEQREYYTKQFATMQSDLEGKIDGQTARNFFTKSKLPILELSHIWELSDMDQDGHLTLDEFCTAFHLVVARKNGYDLPPHLPQGLVPTLIDIGGAEAASRGDLDPFASEHTEHTNNKQKDGNREEWETFSDRTSSSTTLANFDQVPDSNQENLHYPVALRMTPSQVKGEDTTLDEGSTTSSPRGHAKRRPATNPYGYLKNEFSEPDSCDDAGKREVNIPSPSPTSSGESTPSKEEPYRGNQRQGRSSTASSSSSVASSDHSSDNHSFHDNLDRSDPEHSDWSSRPLRPRSDSNSSLESAPPPPTLPAPTPPPRPRIDPPEQGSSSNSLDKNQAKSGLQEPERRVDGPTPPPRPTNNNNINKETAPALPQESFADFSNFNQSSQNNETETLEKSNSLKRENEIKKPIPAPRPHKEVLKSSDSTELEGKEENIAQKKAPTKPPRTRVKSSEVIKEPLTLSPLSISNEDTKIAPPPTQDTSSTKTKLQDNIRELKNKNTQLSRLNGDLQQSLKDVMETRITIEMNIHQMRPFTQ